MYIVRNCLLALCLFSLSGCAAYQKWATANPKASAALDCAKNDAIAGAPALLADVVAALSGQSPDWSALGSMEAAHGVDAVSCAVEAAMKPAAGAATNPNVARNGAAYLQSRGVK